MRMVAPLSPAIHLGANRIMVIGTRDEKPDMSPDTPAEYPSAGEIGGYLMDTIFMDTLNADLARMRRINRTIKLVPDELRPQAGLKNIESLVIKPSKDLRHVTHAHVRDIPFSVQVLLRTLGDTQHAFVTDLGTGKTNPVLGADPTRFFINYCGWGNDERILCSTPEREALARLTGLGLHDAFRRFHEEGGHYTWWDFRRRGFERGNRGLRIDHFLLSQPALEACTGVSIDTDERGMPKPSDHAPVIVELG